MGENIKITTGRLAGRAQPPSRWSRFKDWLKGRPVAVEERWVFDFDEKRMGFEVRSKGEAWPE